MLNVTNLEVRLEDMFCASGDQLTDSYSLRNGKGDIRTTKHESQKYATAAAGFTTHIEVLQLGFGGGLVHKLQNRAQVADVDASLVQGLCQCGSIHGQRAVVQTVFNLEQTHIRGFKLRHSAGKSNRCMIWICVTDQ